MTSETNHSETQEYLRAQNYFGLLKENVHVFQQGTLPAIDFDGNLILAEKDRLFLAPDGHGGSSATPCPRAPAPATG
jgi:UDP-N-acetylglucosamine/UDP-N-acetylgalactosamine diphosphorylase